MLQPHSCTEHISSEPLTPHEELLLRWWTVTDVCEVVAQLSAGEAPHVALKHEVVDDAFGHVAHAQGHARAMPAWVLTAAVR